MKVLFLTSYYKDNSAISSCLRNIFSEICENVDIEVAHADTNDTFEETLPIKTRYIYSCYDNLVFKEKIKKIFYTYNGLKKIIRLLFYMISKILIYIDVHPRILYPITEYISCKEMEKIISEEKYDCVVSVCAHFSNHYIISKLKKKYKDLKWIAYYLDPYSFSQINKKYKKQKQKFEHQLLCEADEIIITSQMEKEYKKSFFADYLDKATVCEFPNVLNRKTNKRNTTIEFDKTKINCVFTGFIYSGIRDPRYFLSILEKADDNIKFYIVGGIHQMDDWKLCSAGKGINNKFEIVDAVSLDESFKIMNDADILVNLGNSVQNQLPSKIFDYMSVGKPIINVCRIKNCLTLPYMEKYPIVLNLFEGEEINDAKIKEFNEFCQRAKYTEISFDEIRKRFKCSSPKYVAEQIIKLLQ